MYTMIVPVLINDQPRLQLHRDQTLDRVEAFISAYVMWAPGFWSLPVELKVGAHYNVRIHGEVCAIITRTA